MNDTAREAPLRHSGSVHYKGLMNAPAQHCPITRDRRSAPRTSVLFAATLERESQSSTVRVLNLSQSGSSISGDLPAKYSSMTLRCGGISVRASVVWASEDRAGLVFGETIDVKRMLRPLPPRRDYYYHSPGRRPPVGGCVLSRADQEKMHRCASLLGISLPPPRP